VSDPISKQRSAWTEFDASAEAKRVLPLGFSPTFWRRNVRDGVLTSIVCEEPEGWHLSISHVGANGSLIRYPSWDEIAHARYELLSNDLDFVMHLPPPEDYVAVHKTTFHLHEHPGRVTPPDVE
jgi:hypothetical protein